MGNSGVLPGLMDYNDTKEGNKILFALGKYPLVVFIWGGLFH